MSPEIHCRAPVRALGIATDSVGCAGCEVPVPPRRLRPVDRRTEPGFRRRLATPLIPSPVAAPLARAHPGAGTFVAGGRGGDSPHLRNHAARLNPLARGCIISPAGNFLLRQCCARLRRRNTEPATHLFTAAILHKHELRIRRSMTKSPTPALFERRKELRNVYEQHNIGPRDSRSISDAPLCSILW